MTLFLLSPSRGEAQEYVNKFYVATLNCCTWYNDEKLSLFNITRNLYFKKYFSEVDILNELPIVFVKSCPRSETVCIRVDNFLSFSFLFPNILRLYLQITPVFSTKCS